LEIQHQLIKVLLLEKGVKMKVNESGLDRVIRVIVGIALIVLYLFGVLSGTLGIVLTVVGAILLITGLVGFCPLYALLKIQTSKK